VPDGLRDRESGHYRGVVDERTGPEAETGEGEVEVDALTGAEAGEPTRPEPVSGEGAGTEETGPEDPGPERTRFDRMRTSAAGVMMTGIAIGLQEALELPRQHPAFVIQASGEPDGPQGPIDLLFDPDDPTKTVFFNDTATTERDTPSP
jgi:hypothetical protein